MIIVEYMEEEMDNNIVDNKVENNTVEANTVETNTVDNKIDGNNINKKKKKKGSPIVVSLLIVIVIVAFAFIFIELYRIYGPVINPKLDTNHFLNVGYCDRVINMDGTDTHDLIDLPSEVYNSYEELPMQIINRVPRQSLDFNKNSYYFMKVNMKSYMNNITPISGERDGDTMHVTIGYNINEDGCSDSKKESSKNACFLVITDKDNPINDVIIDEFKEMNGKKCRS
jgi:hypothetical protein